MTGQKKHHFNDSAFFRLVGDFVQFKKYSLLKSFGDFKSEYFVFVIPLEW